MGWCASVRFSGFAFATLTIPDSYFKLKSVWPLIRDFPDHATFREKGAKLACADKLGVFLSLTLCNKANFDIYNDLNMMALKKCEIGIKSTNYLLFPDINHLIMLVCLIF